MYKGSCATFRLYPLFKVYRSNLAPCMRRVFCCDIGDFKELSDERRNTDVLSAKKSDVQDYKIHK